MFLSNSLRISFLVIGISTVAVGRFEGYLMDMKRLKQEHAEMLAFLNNEQNQPQVQQEMVNQPGNGGQMMQFNI